VAFMAREVDLGAGEDSDRVSAWRQTVAELFSDQLHHGLPMHKIGLPTFGEMTRQARNAEEALLAAHYCCASAVREQSPIDWPSHFALSDLITRMDQMRFLATGRACLRWLGKVEGHLGHHLMMATLPLANLEWSSLERAILYGANIEGANREMADLPMANLMRTNLARANLQGANLPGANLEWANLLGANLYGASLEWANLEGANLVGVRGLEKVRSWRGARVERKWVEHLKLDAGRLGLVVVDDRDEDVEPAA
jgi:hypothetical protein